MKGFYSEGEKRSPTTPVVEIQSQETLDSESFFISDIIVLTTQTIYASLAPAR